MNVKFHKNCENTGKILKISCVRCNFVKFGGISQQQKFQAVNDEFLQTIMHLELFAFQRHKQGNQQVMIKIEWEKYSIESTCKFPRGCKVLSYNKYKRNY